MNFKLRYIKVHHDMGDEPVTNKGMADSVSILTVKRTKFDI